jgi:HEAT repeat protein
MRKRRIFLLLIGVAAVVLVVVLVASLTREQEPKYKGKKLSEWIMDQQEFVPSPEGPLIKSGLGITEDARDAVRQIGTNAIPYLLKWVQYEQSPTRARVYRVLNPILYRVKPAWQLHDYADHNRADGAASAFVFLGEKAATAVPTLAALMKDRRAPQAADRASRAIRHLSFSVLAADLVLMTNSDPRIRLDSVQRVGSLEGDFHPAVHTLVQCLHDPDVEVAKAAAVVLGRRAVEPQVVVPALIESLHRPVLQADAISALGAFHTKAQPAVPALVELLKDPVPLSRKLASRALRQIDPEALEKLTAQ